jgi:glycosyltransferase involved in cell wall biosynthesis
MRVLQVVPTLDLGGAERLATQLAVCLRGSGHEVAVASLYHPGGARHPGRAPWNEAELRAAGVALRFLGKRPGPDPAMVPRLARVLRELRPEVVHTHTYVLRYLLPALLLGHRCPVVHTLHNLAERDVDRPGRLLHQLAFRLGVVPVAIGRAVAESFERAYRLRPPRVIPNGIPLGRCAAAPGDREAARDELGIPAGSPVVVAVARLSPQKDVAALVRAVAGPRLAALGAHLVVAGDGPLRAELEALARALGAGGRVHLLGERGDVPRLLAAGDLFALSSRWEGNPLAVMEAMAAGKPVVATAVGCVPELVSGETGRLVAPGDAAALEEALAGLAGDPAAARRLGEAAARVARARFDVAAMARAYEALYAEVA